MSFAGMDNDSSDGDTDTDQKQASALLQMRKSRRDFKRQTGKPMKHRPKGANKGGGAPFKPWWDSSGGGQSGGPPRIKGFRPKGKGPPSTPGKGPPRFWNQAPGSPFSKSKGKKKRATEEDDVDVLLAEHVQISDCEVQGESTTRD